MAQKAQNVRLSKDVKPTHYKIHFTPDLDSFIFSGTEDISLILKKAAKSVTLHSAEIEIQKATYTHGKMSVEGVVSYDDKAETATISFAKPVPKGKGVLHLEFAGILNDKMRGFYRSRYQHDGKEYHMATTQFESTDARRAFPCFDEPAHKAVFEVALTVPSDRTVISNTIETDIVEHEGGFKTVSFAPSPVMSSYLLAMIVGHFEHIEKKTKRGTLVRVFVRPGKKKQAEFALGVAVKALTFYEDYFAIKYPLPTADLIAIPDFASGAMENWGAVTYRETALLVDPDHSNVHARQRVTVVITHELAHQWFGNLVTMEWWTHLWLNEGFASYIEYLAADHIFPEWHMWTQFLFEDHARALRLDGLKSTHPIEVPVHHPAEISQIFDAVSYSKGASILRMLATYIGEKNFRNGLRHYLKKHSYANASTEDLWHSLEKASGKKVGKLMRDWTSQGGYPLLAVSDSPKGVVVKQSHFIANGGKGMGTKWQVPLAVMRATKKKPDQYMLTGASETIKKYPANEWIKLNAGETSFVRVKYSPERLALLEQELQKKRPALSEEDRFGLIRDAFALAEAGQQSTASVLKLAKTYQNDESYIVWATITENILRISNMIADQPYFGDFKRYVRELYTPLGKKIGWTKKPKEKYDFTLLRGMVMSVLGMHDDPDTVEYALKHFVQAKKGGIHPDIRGTVYNLVAMHGTNEQYAELKKMFATEDLEEEKDRLLRALCLSRDEKHLQVQLDHAFSPETRGQDAVKALAFIMNNPHGREVAWTHFKRSWHEIERRHGQGGHLFPRFISPLSHFTTRQKAAEIIMFFKKNPPTGTERTVEQVLEQIESNVAWIDRDRQELTLYVAEA